MIDRDLLIQKTAIAIGACLCSEETICATCGVEAERAIDFLLPYVLEELVPPILKEAADEIERLRSIVYQYRDDLQHPPSADSMQRRLKMIDDALEGK